MRDCKLSGLKKDHTRSGRFRIVAEIQTNLCSTVPAIFQSFEKGEFVTTPQTPKVVQKPHLFSNLLL